MRRSDHTDRFPGLQMDESSRRLAHIHAIIGTLPHRAAGGDHDGVDGTAVAFQKDQELLPVPLVVEAKQTKPHVGHPHAQALSGTEVPMKGHGPFHIIPEASHFHPSQ